MKLTDKQLRECIKGGHWCNIERRPEMARQLLAARKALRKINSMLGSSHWVVEIIDKALKPPQEPKP